MEKFASYQLNDAADFDFDVEWHNQIIAQEKARNSNNSKSSAASSSSLVSSASRFPGGTTMLVVFCGAVLLFILVSSESLLRLREPMMMAKSGASVLPLILTASNEYGDTKASKFPYPFLG